MSQTKNSPPRKSEPDFIEFSKVQRSYLNEVLNRQRQEFNEVIDSVYDEMGITEKILQAPPGMYKLRQDCSGLDVLPVIPKKSEKDS